MWICQRCHAQNRESAAACENCGAVRAAGRFGAAPAGSAARPPRVSAPAAPAAPAPVSAPTAQIAPPRGPVTPSVPPEAKPRPEKDLGFARVIGAALCVLLPLLTALLAWRQYDALSQALLPLLLNDGAADWARLLCYIALALIAGLLSLLPGLWTLLLARRSSK